MKLSDRTYLIIVLAMIVGLVLVSFWHVRRAQRELPQFDLSEIMKPPQTETEFEPLEWQTPFPWEETKEKQAWVSPDNSLKLVYPASWVIMDERAFGQTTEAKIMLIESEILLFAYRLKTIEQAFGFLTVSRLSTKKTLEEITGEMEENIEQEEGEIEMTISETEGETVTFEATTKYPSQNIFHSSGEIIFKENEVYIISITTPQHNWSQFEEEAKEILDSIELLE